MGMKKTPALVAALAAAVLIANVAPAGAQTAALELSSGSSTKGPYSGSSKKEEPKPPANPPAARPLEGSYTGSAPLSLALAALATAAAIQIVVDLVPPVRAAVDEAAAQLGLTHVVGSSEGNRIIPAKQLQAMAAEFMRQVSAQM